MPYEIADQIVTIKFFLHLIQFSIDFIFIQFFSANTLKLIELINPLFAKRITNQTFKFRFVEQIQLKICQRIKIIHSPKLRVISHREVDRKLKTLISGISHRNSTNAYRTQFLYGKAHSALESHKTLLSIEPFWERTISDPPIQLEKRRIQVKLAILARENITLDTRLQTKPTDVILLPESKLRLRMQLNTLNENDKLDIAN